MKVALRKRNGILEFLGFVDGKGRIRKAKVRKVNPVISTSKTWGRQKAEWDKRYQVMIHSQKVPTRAFDTLAKARDLVRRAKSYHGVHWDIYDRETGEFIDKGVIK
jgi:hypothetical protein